MDIISQIPTGGEKCETLSPKQASSPSLLDNLKRRQADATERLQDLNAAIDALEKNPDVAKVLELVARAR